MGALLLPGGEPSSIDVMWSTPVKSSGRKSEMYRNYKHPPTTASSASMSSDHWSFARTHCQRMP